MSCRLRCLIRMLRLVRVPGMPVVPGFLARMALAEPRLVPCFLRWRVATGGLGLVIADLVGSSNSTAPEILEELGRRQGRHIRERLDYGRTPGECARTVALANRLFGIKARVQVEGPHRALLVTPGCPWSGKKWWGPQPCGAFSRYERGLVAGMDSRVRLTYREKKTRGDSRCVGVYEWKEPGKG